MHSIAHWLAKKYKFNVNNNVLPIRNISLSTTKVYGRLLMDSFRSYAFPQHGIETDTKK